MINNKFNFLIFISSIFIISLLFYRNHSLYPSVMGDEYINNIFSKNINFKDMLIQVTYIFIFIKFHMFVKLVI